MDSLLRFQIGATFARARDSDAYPGCATRSKRISPSHMEVILMV